MHDVLPLETDESWIHRRLVSNYQPVSEIFLLKLPLVDVILFIWGLFETHWAHIMVVAMVDVSLVGVLEPSFESF